MAARDSGRDVSSPPSAAGRSEIQTFASASPGYSKLRIFRSYRRATVHEMITPFFCDGGLGVMSLSSTEWSA